MRKLEAAQWYHYMYDGDMTNFQSYYLQYKQWFDNNPLDPKYLAPTEQPQVSENTVPCQEKGNNPMRDCDCDYCDAPKTRRSVSAGAGVIINSSPVVETAEEQRKYLGARALDTISSKIGQLQEKFKMSFDWRPKTVQEANERLRAGLFTIYGADKKDPVVYPWGGLQSMFSWRGPDDQEDKEGYDAARDKFAEFYKPILDEIRIFDPKDALESLRKIEAYEI